MYIELAKQENYRGKKHQAGDIIEVGDALGYRMVLNGHKMSNSEAHAAQLVKKSDDNNDAGGKSVRDATPEDSGVLSDEEVDALDYKELQGFVKKHEVEADGKSSDDYKTALKAFFTEKRGE